MHIVFDSFWNLCPFIWPDSEETGVCHAFLPTDIDGESGEVRFKNLWYTDQCFYWRGKCRKASETCKKGVSHEAR